MSRLVVWLGLFLPCLLLPQAEAHEVRLGFLELREVAANAFVMTWKVPALGTYRLGIYPRLPDSCRVTGEPSSAETDGAFIDHSRIRCDHGLDAQTISIDGLDATMTDVLVRIERADGSTLNARLTPSNPSLVVQRRSGPLTVLQTYVGLGVEHILFGIDHLLFVLCLLLLIRDIRNLLQTITAFTLAHSITLAAATLGLVHVPRAPVEATIALSIVFLASELLRGQSGRSEVTRSYPWLIAFSFGLLHGLGFAGALAEIGLPQGEIPLALFAFNIGVELGQIAFLTAVLSLGRLAGFMRLRWPRWATPAAGYAIGSVAAFWVLERLMAAV
jgi:hydrogenase/urease accessory protein HupE